MDKFLKKSGDKPRAGKIDSFFSRQDKKQSPNRAILDNITNNMAGSPEKTEEPLVKSPIISKSHKIESEVIEGTPDVTVGKSRLKRKRHEIFVEKEESKIKPEVEIPVSDNCRSPIFKRKRYSGDTDDKELVNDKLKTPVKISSEENEDLLACLEDSPFSTTPVKTQKSPEKSIKEEVNAPLKTPVKSSHDDEEDLLACLEDSPFSTTPAKPKESPEKSRAEVSKLGRHKVVSVEKAGGSLSLTLLEDSGSSHVKSLVLKGSWVTTDIKVNDIVNVVADWSGDSALIDDKAGSVIVNPDVLVSGTAVVSALFCMRKAVLSEKFKGLEGGNRVMLVGTMVHELLQEVVKERKYSKAEILGLLDRIMVSPRTMSDILSLGLQEDDLRKEVEGFVGHIQYFVRKFLLGENLEKPRVEEETKKKPGQQRQQWRGKITEICDIEENFWSPRLGMKGKIDLTVKTESQGGESVVRPLEIKTGKPSYSHSHQGQVMLYCLMSRDRREQARAGLLLYLRSSDLSEVPAGQQETRGLLQLRNQLVSWLGESQLPEPVSHPSCQSCGLLTVCSAYQKVEEEVPRPPHPMADLVPKALLHLKRPHLAWFNKWTSLLDLEAGGARGGAQLRDLWCLAPEERERRGQAYTDLRLSRVEAGDHTFTREAALDWRQGPTAGEMVVVSSLTSLALAQGMLRSVDSNTLLVSLDKTLPVDSTYHVDRMIYNTANSSCYQGLARMLEDSPQGKFMRNSIIDMVPPEFKHGLSREVAQHGRVVLRDLNKVQQRAVVRSIMCESYCLIRGMPGTGKTTTIVGLVRLLARLGQSVLVVAYTNSAVDTILAKLQEKGERFLRLGRRERVKAELVESCAENLAERCNSVSQLRSEYLSYKIVASTCLAVSHPATAIRKFDWVVCDEASQALLPSVLSALMLAGKFVLVGDHAQLAPTVQSQAARAGGLDQSLFSILDTAQPGVTSSLNLQYRMNNKIQELANHLTYQGGLQAGSPEVSQRVLSLEAVPEDWRGDCLTSDPDRAVMFVDTVRLAREDKQTGGIFNAREGQLVKCLVSVLVSQLVDQSDIGVIAPYSAQVKFIKAELKSQYPEVEVGTVDQYQGRDKLVIIYSCTRSNYGHIEQVSAGHILLDTRRLNVAVTRAKAKLIIIGDRETLVRDYQPFKNMISFFQPSAVLKLNEKDFDVYH